MNSESSSNPSRAMKSSVKVLLCHLPGRDPENARRRRVEHRDRAAALDHHHPVQQMVEHAPVDIGAPLRHRPTRSTSMFQVSSVVPSVRSSAVSAFS